MDSGVAPHLSPYSPIFFRTAPRNSLHVVRWCVWHAVEAASPRCIVPLQAARIGLGMRFILFLVASQSKGGASVCFSFSASLFSASQ
jgi:hypothetical protein